MVAATYTLDADLDGDGIFETSLLADVVGEGRTLMRSVRGRDQARSLAPPAAGDCGFPLDDGPSHGNGAYAPGVTMAAGRPVRWRAAYAGTTYDLFRGLIARPTQAPQPSMRKTVQCDLLGMLSRLAGKTLSTALYSAITTDIAIGHLLDAAAWPKNFAAHLTGELDNLAGYWPLGEASGDAIDGSGNGNDGTVTIGAGSRDQAALDDAGDGCIDFDGAATLVSIADDAAIQNLWDGGGSLLFLINLDSDGEGSVGRIADKSAWYLDAQDEAAGFVRLNFRVGFSGAAGIWQTAVNLPISTTLIGVLTYDADAVANNPTLRIWDGDSWAALTVGSGLTETSTPVGTRTTDVGSALVIGNNAGATATADARIDEIALLSDTVTAAEAAALASRALDAPRHLDTGKTTLAWWWLDEQDAFEALRALWASEGPGANVYEDGTGAIVFKNRHARVTETRSTAVQQTFRSATGAVEPLLSMPYQFDPGFLNVVNRCSATVKTRAAAASAEIWALGSTITLAASETRKYGARQADGTPFNAAVTPTSGGGDYTVSAGSLSNVTLDRTSGASVTITLTAGSSGATVTGLRLRAASVPVTNTIQVEGTVDTAASQEQHGVQTYTIPLRAEVAVDDAQNFCNAVEGYYQEGRPTAVLTVLGNLAAARLTAALSLEVGDRVRVIEGNTSIDKQFHLERVAQQVDKPATHTTTLALEEVSAAANAFTLDTSELDGGDVLWF